VFGSGRLTQRAHKGRRSTLHLGDDVVNALFGSDAPIMLMGLHWMNGLTFSFSESEVGISEYV
jgi:hypothetical protein